jgi:hypothetical protein
LHKGISLPKERLIVLGCVTCEVMERLPLDLRLPELARRFLVMHADCVTSIDLDSIHLFRTLADAL